MVTLYLRKRDERRGGDYLTGINGDPVGREDE